MTDEDHIKQKDEITLFERCESTSNGYFVKITNMFQYQICMDILQHGASFRMIENVTESLKASLKDFRFGYINRQKVSRFAKICCAHSYQTLLELLDKMWAFSLAVDCGNKSGMEFIDTIIRCVFKSKLYNLHLMAIPLGPDEDQTGNLS